jgi:hypothetical protein
MATWPDNCFSIENPSIFLLWKIPAYMDLFNIGFFEPGRAHIVSKGCFNIFASFMNSIGNL